MAIAENRHADLLVRRERRLHELERQRSLSLQGVDRITSVLLLPHPENDSPELANIRPNLETEATAMRVVIEYEENKGRKVFDVHEKNLGYDVTSLDVISGEVRLIEVKGLKAPTGTVLLSPNERRVAEDRRDCFWLYIVTNCGDEPVLQEPIPDPAQHPWNEVKKVQHYYLDVGAMTQSLEESDDT